MSRSWIMPIAIAGLAAVVVAMIGGTITHLGPWYEGLAKPDWAPPRPVFPIAWTTILALAAIAAVSAWRAAATDKVSDTIVGLFALTGFLNLLWSLLFFRIQRPDWAFIEVIGLWLSILALVVYCGRHSKLAGALLLPYLVWVTIAAALNWQIVQLNGPFG